MLILEGEIEILSDRDTLVTIHRPGNFSGDVDMIAGHPAVVRARATPRGPRPRGARRNAFAASSRRTRS